MNKLYDGRTWTDNIFCHYGHRIYSKVWVDRSRMNYCPLCNELLELNDNFYLVINNSRLFPNCLIHAKCIVEKSSVEGLSWLNFNRATEFMIENYRTFKSTYKAWIRE